MKTLLRKPTILWVSASVLLLTEKNVAADESCDNPISHSFTCSTTSLCEEGSNAQADAYCFQMRSCLFGYCSTSDIVELESAEGACSLLEEGQIDDEALCLDNWDSSWWMTDYFQAVDCADTSVVYLDCTKTVGNISQSTAASLGFSAVGVAALVGWFLQKRQRQSQALVQLDHECDDGDAEMTSKFTRM